MNDYASPIEMITNSIIKSDEEQLEDCMLFSVEREIGFKVDKEELIKALEYDRKQYEKGFEDGLKSAMEWIPVSEGLPEDHKDVLICLSSDEICIGSYNSHRLPFSNHAIGWGASYVHNWCSDDVIAWMPLPKSYKQEVQSD